MSDPYKRAALTFCNQIRKELGLPRRTKLLKGMSTGYGCPVARTIGAAARYARPTCSSSCTSSTTASSRSCGARMSESLYFLVTNIWVWYILIVAVVSLVYWWAK
jgi:hypothetical protein